MIRGYILLEALVVTTLFAMLVSLVLTEVAASRRRQAHYLEQEEVYQVAKMAVQTGQDSLVLNGQEIRIDRTDEEWIIWQEGEALVRLKKN